MILRKITVVIASLQYTLTFIKSIIRLPYEIQSLGKSEIVRSGIFESIWGDNTLEIIDRISNLIWPLTSLSMIVFLLSFVFEKKIIVNGNHVNSVGENQNTTNLNDQPSTGLNIISFLIPLVGLIIYLTEREKSPIKATSAGKAALWGVGVTIVLSIISFFVMFSIISSIN
jgi:hypothetical protein